MFRFIRRVLDIMLIVGVFLLGFILGGGQLHVDMLPGGILSALEEVAHWDIAQEISEAIASSEWLSGAVQCITETVKNILE